MSGKGRTQDRGVCSLLPPGRVCRHYVLPRRFMQALWPRSLLPGPNSTNIVWSCFLQILSSASSPTLLLPSSLLHICLGTTTPQTSSTNANISIQQRCLIDSHAVTQKSAVVFFHRGFVRHITPATPPAAHLHAKKHLLQRRQRSLSSHPNGSPQPARL